MLLNNDHFPYEECPSTLKDVNNKLISITDKLLYNTRFGLNRHVDKNLFALLVFYKEALTDICEDEDCGCYTTPECSHLDHDIPNTGFPTAKINECVCGCCPPLNPVCNKVPCVSTTCNPRHGDCESIALTKQNIIERIKILTA